jgi:hypothetical protein
LQQQTCVRFVRRTTEPTYILLRNTNHGYVSHTHTQTHTHTHTHKEF